MSDQIPGLAALLGSMSVSTFLAQHWDQAPLVVRARDAGGPGRLAAVLRADHLDGLIAESGLRGGMFRLSRDGQEVDAVTWGIPALSWGPGHVQHFARPERMFDLIRDGWTLTIESADRICESVAGLVHRLRQDVVADCHAQIVFSPAGTPVTAPRYDVQSAFVLQCRGVGHWRVYGPHIERPLRDEGGKGPVVGGGELRLDVRLEPGDMLYVPRGFVHTVAGAADIESLHVSVGVVPTTWFDLVQAAIAHLHREVGGVGDQAVRLDTRTPVSLAEPREDWLDEQIEATLCELDIQATLEARVAQSVRSGSEPSLSSALGLDEGGAR